MLEKRGRKSAADQSAPVVELPNTRPEPPPDLCPRAAEAWRNAVAVMPPRHFDQARQLVLRGYCHHVAASDAIWPRYLAALEDPGCDPAELVSLQKMFDRETDGVRHSARHLGLLEVGRHYRKVPRYSPRPWEL
jgi:hypothetical protein